MPHRRSPAPPAKEKPTGTFRQRYDDLEARREALVARLRGMGEPAEKHPAFKRALKLLNDTYRKSRLAQRLAILEAAAWLIDVLEKLALTL